MSVPYELLCAQGNLVSPRGQSTVGKGQRLVQRLVVKTSIHILGQAK